MAAVNNKGNCYVWNLSNNKETQLTETMPKLKIDTHTKFALRCKFSPDSNYLITTSIGVVKIYQTDNFELWQELKLDSNRWVWDAVFSNDSKYLFTGNLKNRIQLPFIKI